MTATISSTAERRLRPSKAQDYRCCRERSSVSIDRVSSRMRRSSSRARSARVRSCSALAVSSGHAGQLLVTAGQNIQRLRNDGAVAALSGASPSPASSGRTNRHRLNHGCDRDANRALHMIAVCRLRYSARTRAYAQRRAAEGKTKPEIIRCLKRYIAREIYRNLHADLANLTHP